MKVIVIGGGWAGCAAAVSAKKQGADVVLLERTDMLLGTGLVGGIMRNNGRLTATEELKAMGGGDIFAVIESNFIHRDITFPGHNHASLYDVSTMEPKIRRFLHDLGIRVEMGCRVTDVDMEKTQITGVMGKKAKDTFRFDADVFIETTGTAGPPANCVKHGNGCAMCILRCHSFGGRVSVAARAGVAEINGQKGSQTGAVSGSCKLHKESLAPDLQKELNETGVAVIALAEHLRMAGKLSLKACQQYAIADFENNVILLDTGHAKLMTPFFPLDGLRKIPGLENARFEDPYAGGIGNSVRYMGMSPRDDALKVDGVDNLFCAGEKAGLMVGHTEAICTGTLAGVNAVKQARGKAHLVLPEDSVLGDAVAFVRQQMQTPEGLGLKFTFSGSVLFDRMKSKEMYTTDPGAVADRIKKAGLEKILA
ncbi:MAG TPA: FAD-dependent oxidoreductase [Desulfotignum sp.]|nr:FAD-dependent oxidoreductase [Desulfotignum sp.]